MKNKKSYVYIGLPVLGMIFYLAYIKRSAIDMVYSDYIRLINSYLPDVWNPDKFFVVDLLTRIPVNFLERGLNVMIFGYSVTVDRIMGVLGFGLSALVIGWYSRKKELCPLWYAAMMIVMFSLNKWEMLYNGTGWAHFLAFGLFFWNYALLDQVYEKGFRNAKRSELVLLFVLPFVITIGAAGPYCAIYTVTIVMAYLFIYVRDILMVKILAGRCQAKVDRQHTASESGKNVPGRPHGKAGVIGVISDDLAGIGTARTIALIAVAVIPFLIYLWSNSQAVYEYSGAVNVPLFTAFRQDPKFFIKFLLKSFASMVFGVELIDRNFAGIPGKVWCAVGVIVLFAYFFALWMNFYYRIEEQTILPLMLLAGGGMNHLMVLVSRYIFMPNDKYGMSSRYALQYQIGVIGIFLTFALAAKCGFCRKEESRDNGSAGTKGMRRNCTAKKSEDTGSNVGLSAESTYNVSDGQRQRSIVPACVRTLSIALAAMFLIGNVMTTAEEFRFGKYRKEHNRDEVKQILLNFENESDKTLEDALEYHKPGCRAALTILKENGWNIWR